MNYGRFLSKDGKRGGIPDGIARRVKYPTKRPKRLTIVLIRPNAIAIAVSEEARYK